MSDEIKNYLSILSERFDDKIKILAEGQAGILHKVEEIQQVQKQDSEEIKVINIRLGIVENNLTTIKKDIKEIKSDIQEKDHQLKTLNQRVKKLELA